MHGSTQTAKSPASMKASWIRCRYARILRQPCASGRFAIQARGDASWSNPRKTSQVATCLPRLRETAVAAASDSRPSTPRHHRHVEQSPRHVPKSATINPQPACMRRFLATRKAPTASLAAPAHSKPARMDSATQVAQRQWRHQQNTPNHTSQRHNRGSRKSIPPSPQPQKRMPTATLIAQGAALPTSRMHVQQQAHAWQSLWNWAPCDRKADRNAATVQLSQAATTKLSWPPHR